MTTLRFPVVPPSSGRHGRVSGADIQAMTLPRVQAYHRRRKRQRALVIALGFIGSLGIYSEHGWMGLFAIALCGVLVVVYERVLQWRPARRSR